MPGDSRVERVLDNLNTLIEQPTGWSPSDAHAWQAVAADAKRVIESMDELGPDSAIEQGVSRLQMIAFLAGDPGPYWNGKHGDQNRWVRYRAHHVDRDELADGLLVAVQYTDHVGDVGRVFLDIVQPSTDPQLGAVRMLRDIDHLLDAVLAAQPLRPDVQAAMDVEANTIDRVLGVARQVADQTATDPVANTAVWDVIDRIQKLRPIDAPTEQDRAEAEADDEREAKAQQRSADWVDDQMHLDYTRGDN